jgi:predicted ATPase
MRFRMLDSIREYAEAQLSPDARRGLETRHRDYYAGLAETARKQYSGSEQALVLDRLEQEHENLRAAIRGGLEQKPRQALQTAADLWRFWQAHGHYQPGRAILAQVLDHPANQLPLGNESANARAFALNGAGSLAWSQGDFETARRCQEQCLDA